MVGLSGHPYKTPQDPGREAESPGSGLPLQKYRRGRGSSRELSQRLSSQRNSFQGNVSLSPSTEEPSLSAPGSVDPGVSSTWFVFFRCCISAHRRCCGKIRPGQHTHSVLLQSKHPLKQYPTGWWCCSPGLKDKAGIFQANIEHSPGSLDRTAVGELHSFQAKIKNMKWLKVILECHSFSFMVVLPQTEGYNEHNALNSLSVMRYSTAVHRKVHMRS